MINVLGASDAHDPFGIGTAWSGVLGAKCEASSIIKAIKKGVVSPANLVCLNSSVMINQWGQQSVVIEVNY